MYLKSHPLVVKNEFFCTNTIPQYTSSPNLLNENMTTDVRLLRVAIFSGAGQPFFGQFSVVNFQMKCVEKFKCFRMGTWLASWYSSF